MARKPPELSRVEREFLFRLSFFADQAAPLRSILRMLGMTYAAAAEVLDELEARGVIETIWDSPDGPGVRRATTKRTGWVPPR